MIHNVALSQSDIDIYIAWAQVGLPTGGQPLLNPYNATSVMLNRLNVGGSVPSLNTVAGEVVLSSSAQPALSSTNPVTRPQRRADHHEQT